MEYSSPCEQAIAQMKTYISSQVNKAGPPPQLEHPHLRVVTELDGPTKAILPGQALPVHDTHTRDQVMPYELRLYVAAWNKGLEVSAIRGKTGWTEEQLEVADPWVLDMPLRAPGGLHTFRPLSPSTPGLHYRTPNDQDQWVVEARPFSLGDWMEIQQGREEGAGKTCPFLAIEQEGPGTSTFFSPEEGRTIRVKKLPIPFWVSPAEWTFGSPLPNAQQLRLDWAVQVWRQTKGLTGRRIYLCRAGQLDERTLTHEQFYQSAADWCWRRETYGGRHIKLGADLDEVQNFLSGESPVRIRPRPPAGAGVNVRGPAMP